MNLKQRFSTDILIVLLTAALLALGLAGCSLKKNTAATRKYQAFITRYNIYYNGDEHYKETLRDMERTYEDDYSSLLFMHPAEAYANEEAPQPTGDFTRSIEKAQKAIQLRSIKKRPAKKAGKSSDPAYKAWMKRDEYNPFLHNAWMMMARSQYLNGDFLGAASTFFYVSKHFVWLPQTVTEAKLWQARSYVALDWLFEAETILTRIKVEEELTSSTLKGLYYFTFADYYLRSKEFDNAAKMLAEAIKFADGPQRTRLTFLLGQVYQRLGRKDLAYEAFAKAGKASSATYRTKFNARIKQSEVFDGADIEPEVKALKRMTRYDRNAEYLDQVYYAIGNLYLSRRDTLKAIDNYELALEKSKRNGIDKAIAALTLGALYFERHEYNDAQRCYAEAVPQIPETYPDYQAIKRRGDVLDELAIYSQNVTLQDSLLKLSNMTEEQQLAVVNKIIDDLKKKEKEEEEAAKREEYLAQQAAAGNGLQQGSSAAPSTFTQNTDKSWYFYNTATRNAGKTEFQKRWGSRKLEDNWRRRNKASFNFDDFEEGAADSGDPDATDENGEGATADENTPTKEQLEHESDPHFPEYYLKQIPKNDIERATSNEVIQEGLYNMGVILKDKLEDFPSSAVEFNRLLSRYPDNVYRLETYYNLYLMAVRSGDNSAAEKWRRLIVDQFADSSLGTAMRDPAYFDNLRNMEASQERLYAQTYDDYLANRNQKVHDAYRKMQTDFPLSKIMPKFMFLHALAYVTENKPDEFNATLRELLERYPDTDITPLASAYLKGMAQGRKLHAGTSNMRGMAWNLRLSNDSTTLESEVAPIEFDLSPDQPMELLLIYPTDSVSANQLLYDVARFNFTSFMVRDFDLEVMNFGNLGLLLIKEFANQRDLDHYRRIMAGDNGLKLPPSVIPVMISVKNFDTLLRSGGSLQQYFEAIGDDTLERIHFTGVPEEPETPDVTEATETPETPGVTEAPDAPETPDVPEVPDAPGTPDVPQTPETPDAPETPDIPQTPETPDAPETPDVPQTPATPGTPDAPQTPETPGTPDAPQTPKAPAPATPKKPAKKPAPVPQPIPAGSEEDDDDPLLDF